MANIINKRRMGIFYDGRKAVDLWGDNLDGWTVFSGNQDTTDANYYKFIPTLYRGIDLCAGAVAAMPFEIRKGKTTVYDSSAEWKNKVGFMPNPQALFRLVESALILYGRAYLFREKSVATTKELRYHLPTSVTPKIDEVTGKIQYFERPVRNVPTKFAPEDYVYFWLTDPTVEVGPPNNYPAKAAANACGVLLNIDLFAAGFFERGAIKAMLLTVKGMPAEAERSKLEEWWKRVVGGVKNAFGAKVVNAEAVTPVVVGEGMKELENVTVGQEKREDIAVALGIPMSILFANAANYATSQQDDLNFLTKRVIPDCETIAAVFNEQLFEPLGLHLEFLPETLDAMQEDETARAAGLQQLVNSGVPLLMAMDILGYELTDEQRAELEAAEAEKKKRAEELAKQVANKPAEPPAQEPGQEDDKQPPPEEDQAVTKALGAWKRFAMRMVKSDRPANEEFENDVIPLDVHERVMVELAKCKTAEDVRAVFANCELTARTPEDVAALLEGIKLGVEALKVSA